MRLSYNYHIIIMRTFSTMLTLALQVTADRPVVIDTLKNVTDLFLPLATLGYVQTSDGFQGLMGMISSYMSLLAVWNPAFKLSPS